MKSVVILGAVPGQRVRASYAGEVWGCNNLWPVSLNTDGKFCATRWFELHPRRVNTPVEQAMVYTCPVPIYVLSVEDWAIMDIDKVMPSCLSLKKRFFVPDAEPSYDNLREFPYDSVKRYGDWYRSTFAYQTALAIHEGFEEIVYLGCDLTRGSKRERLIERANLEWWLGYAEGLGIRVVQPGESGMSRQWNGLRYGYDYDEEAQDAKVEVQALFDVAPWE